MHTNIIFVLVVEDEPAQSRLIEMALSRLSQPGFEVSIAGNIEETVSKLRRRKPDVILLDLSLPDSSDLEGLSQVQSAAKDVPIVVMTDQEQTDLAVTAVKRGAEDYLTKGKFDIRGLRRSVLYAIERRKTQRELDEERRRLEEMTRRVKLLQQREEFVATLTHDLKVPLIGAERVLDVILQSTIGHLPEEQLKLLNLLKKNNRSMLDLVYNQLEVYRYESGDEYLNFELIQLDTLVNDCVDELKFLANVGNVTVKCIYPESLRPICVDRSGIRRVIVNLLGNAIKYSPAGGMIEISVAADHDWLRVSIKDGGAGITADDLGKLFQPFARGEAGKGPCDGSGLGLYVCRKIMEAHGGEIACKSAAGRGSTFTIRMPFSRRSQLTASQPQSS